MRGYLAAAAAASMLTGCAAARNDQSPSRFHGVPLSPNVRCADAGCTSYNVTPYVRTRSRHGIGCLGNVPPGQTPNPEPPPESYPAALAGEPGVPRLTAAESAMLRRIRRAVRSKTLRIAWVDGSSDAPEFIVFDATDGPCETWAGGYAVLNGDCNEFYEPGENPYRTHAGSGCLPSSRPWMKPSSR